MQIFIPSTGRAELHRTWFNLPPQWQARAALVLPPKEVPAYRARCSASILATKVSGIGKVRHEVIQNAPGAVLMLDDDLDFFVRRKDDPTKLIKASPRDIDKMLTKCEKLLNKFAHIGVATREGANRVVEEVVYNTRLLRALGYRADVLREHRVAFDRLPVMEDFDVALQLLQLGYRSAQLNSHVQDQPGSNTAGGCSTYRTNQVQAAGALGLKKLHPDFVTVVAKPPLKSGGWGGEARTDVKVAWKKAFASYGVAEGRKI